MKCLIDADILSYEISAAGQFKEIDELTGEEVLVIRDFQAVADLFDQRIKEIEGECWATEPSTLYLTGDERLFRSINRKRRRNGEEELKEFKDNFRKQVAKTKEYKGHRKAEKPFHFHNLREYMLHHYNVVVAMGVEADALIAIEMPGRDDVICCTRDKDLRMVEGMHFGWPCGAQPQYGPKRVDNLGHLYYDEEKNKLTGEGYLFFCSQLITGDSTDNIPGLPRGGPRLAFELLHDAPNESEALNRVEECYATKLGQDYNEYFEEQRMLLWMLRELPEGASYEVFSNQVQS